MEEYYVFWMEKHSGGSAHYCTHIADLLPREINLYCELIEKSSNEWRQYMCRIDDSDSIPTLEFPDEYVIQKKKAAYSPFEKIRLGRLLDCHKDWLGNYQLNSTADLLQRIADEVRSLRNDNEVVWDETEQSADSKIQNSELAKEHFIYILEIEDIYACSTSWRIIASCKTNNDFEITNAARIYATKKIQEGPRDTSDYVFGCCGSDGVPLDESYHQLRKHKNLDPRILRSVTIATEARMYDNDLSQDSPEQFIRLVVGFLERRNDRTNDEYTATKEKHTIQDFESKPIDVAKNIPSMPYSAASGKGNRPTIPFEIYGEEAMIDPANDPGAVYIQNDDGKVIEDAVYRGTLKATYVSQNLPEKERNRLLYETLGMGPTEIARRNGTPEKDVASEADRIKKQLQRSKPK